MAQIESSYVTVTGVGVLGFVDREADRTVVWLRGEYDLASVPALAELLARAIAIDDGDLVLDLRGVQFMDASTIGVLVRVDQFLGCRSRSLRLRSPSRIALRLLEVCKLTGLLETRSAEVASLTATAGALGSWVAVPATERVDPKPDASSPGQTSGDVPACDGGRGAAEAPPAGTRDRAGADTARLAGRQGS